jgi:flagellar M-ring protein FliF
MAFWNSLREQLLALWSRWTIGQRVGLSAAAIACAAAVIGTLLWASQPDYMILISNYPSSRVAEIAGMLDTEKISYKLNVSGTSISVPSSDLARARMAVGDDLEPDFSGKKPELSFLPGSPEDASTRRLRADEIRIREMIQRNREVRSAIVSIGRPDDSPFVSQQNPVTASVSVELKKQGGRLSNQSADAILNIVANAVPGLKVDNITLTDSAGIQYGKKAHMESELEMQREHKRSVENEIAYRVEQLLQRMSGVRASVNVTAEIDFSSIQEKRNTVDPDSKVTIREKILNSKYDGLVSPPGGLAGSATNIPAGAAAAVSQSGGTQKTEEIDTESEVSRIVQDIQDPRGKITRLNVAAIVDVQAPSTGAAPDPNNPSPAPTVQGISQEELEELVKGAVGYDVARNDEVHVTMRPLVPEAIDVPVAVGFVWEQWQPLVQYTSLGLAALLAFFIGMMLMKRMKPIVITETVGPGIPLADARRLAVLSEQAKSNPDVVASILSAWLNEQEQLTASPAVAAQGRNAYRAASDGGDKSSDDAGTKRNRTQATRQEEGKRAA